jgi:chromosome segregation and condensation protein ScpB
MTRRPAPAQNQGLDQERTLDRELDDLPAPARRRVWMGRIEAAIFAAPEPLGREVLAALVGRGCDLDGLIADIRAELAARPYELVRLAGGWTLRTRPAFAAAIRAAAGGRSAPRAMSPLEGLALAAVAHLQPVARAELAQALGREVSRDLLARLRALGLIAPGARSPTPGAPPTWVTTAAFLREFDLDTLADLPDIEGLDRPAPDALDWPSPGEEEEDEG